MTNEIKRMSEYDFSEEMISKEEAAQIADIQRAFLKSYLANKDTMPIEEWLSSELSKHLSDRSKTEIDEMSLDIISSLKIAEEKKLSQQKAIASGRSKESWFASELLKSTSQMSAVESAKYLQDIDDAIKNANEAMLETITTKTGAPNLNMNLDGFIAEQYHVNSFNMNAQAKGSKLFAEVLKPKPGETYAKNSVDIVIKDASGKILKKYQAKYGATAEDTIRMIKNGDYRGQRLLVPEEQVDAVKKAFPDKSVSSTIGEGKIESKPLLKEEAKEMQKKAQKGNFLDADWNDLVAKDIAMGIGRQAGYACLQGAAIGVGISIASKVWNGEKIDSKEVIETAIVSGADFGIKTATAGALKLASEKGILKLIPKGTKGSTFANIAFVAIENVKIGIKVFKGELSAKEGLELMEQTTGSCIVGMAASAKGMAIGASIGTVFGLPGIAVGGFVGATVGYIAGSKLGEIVIKGAQKIRSVANETLKTVGEKIRRGIKDAARAFADALES